MRVNELLESVFSQYPEEETKEKKDEIDYNLAEDLAYYMNHNDDVYRRHLFPVVTKCVDQIKANKTTHPGMFKIAVLKSFKDYSNDFPVRQLPVSLDNEVCEEVCKELHEELCKHVEEGKYED